MLNIRSGVFETNSSSCHNLIIRKEDWAKNDVDNHPYIIKGGYYGRCPQIPLESTEDKLNYIWTMVNGLFGLHYIDYTNKVIDYIDKTRFEQWKRMIIKICPNAQLIEPCVDDYNIGIDHVYELESFAKEVEKNPDILQNFLLSYSWIDISGDEYAH